MEMMPDPITCSECGAVLTLLDFGLDASTGRWGPNVTFPMCDLCQRWLCRDHVVSRRGGATCAACEPQYQAIMAAGPVSDADEERIVELLLRDVSNAVASEHQDAIAKIAAHGRLFATDRDHYEQQVVDNVQQYMHDSFADTTWPACPYHPNHPLWYAAGWWRCERLAVDVAKLGALLNRAT